MSILLVLVLAYTGWTFARRAEDRSIENPQEPRRTAELDRIYGGSDLKILQFYAPEPSIVEGSGATLCYGVVNARAVRIEPGVQGLAPSISRCVNVAPERDTRYTLTAEGIGGRTVSESLTITVRPDVAALPKITSFRVGARSSDYSGRTVVSLVFSAVNAETLTITPPVFPPLHDVPNGQFYVTPQKTTTYTLTATNKRGHQVRRQLTVQVANR